MASIDDYLEIITQDYGKSPSKSARILDFGCGQGHAVVSLLQKGYDAWGVDLEKPLIDDNRLKLASQNPYRLPFPDQHFDIIFSEQVMEHVFNHIEIFSELKRVLKPSGISIHHFPGPLYYYEGHVGLPFVLFCMMRPYLFVCALIKSRTEKAHWHDLYERFIRLMANNNYRSKKYLCEAAYTAALTIDFMEGADFLRKHHLRMIANIPLVLTMISPFLQRLMILRPTEMKP